MKNILVWGAGNRTKEYLEKGYFDRYRVVAIVDTYKKEEEYRGIPIIEPNEICLYNDISFIVISNNYYIDVIEKLKSLNEDLCKVVITDAIEYPPYNQYYKRLKEEFFEIYTEIKHQSWISVRKNERDIDDEGSIFGNDNINTNEYDWDYFRYRTFELVADEVIKSDIPGCVAEVGVFQGTFSALINKKFPRRDLFLFDTFEGFDEEESSKEILMGRCNDNFIKAHKDTSVERVLSKLVTPEKAHICKGFFPETVTDDISRRKFALVSLDVDFEESTLAGLKFFYPRMSEGGYIFIHDYNTYFLEGIRIAVEKYENILGKQLKKIPLADRAGTLVIIK